MRNRYVIATAALVLGVLRQPHSAFGQQATPAGQARPATFSSPGEATRALARAVQTHDEQALETILGVGREVTSSGDESLDTLEREQFARKYEEMHRLVQESDGRTVLYLGAENWPFPIPLASTQGRWSFDARAGEEEIGYRRIGENETKVIEGCRTLNRTASPEQSRDGYRFRAVTPQAGGATEGGVGTTGTRASRRGITRRDITRITFVVYPIEYRLSGVMTFIVTEDRRVFEKDLGPDTEARASRIEGRVPAAGWKAVN